MVKIISLEIKRAIEWLMTPLEGETEENIWTPEQIINKEEWAWKGTAEILNTLTRFEVAEILMNGYELSPEDQVLEWYEGLDGNNNLSDYATKIAIATTLNLLNFKIEGIN